MKHKWILRAAVLAAVPSVCLAAGTKTWLQSSASDFEKGDLHGLAIRNDGRLTLAPESHQILDGSVPYLWAMARDSKGVIYAAGGPGAKVYRVANGKSTVVAQFDALEVHALAVNARDEVFAATAPDGRIYRVGAAGKPVEFYDPHQKYIWAMAFDRQGNLFAATGDQGEIHKVTADGRGSVFFKSDETHIRSLVVGNGLVYAGTDPSGLIIRITADGQGFVLFQMPKHEVTTLALASDGSLYAADAGAVSVPAPPPPPAPAPAANGTLALPASPVGSRPAESAAPAAAAGTFSGGSDVFRILQNGFPERYWSSTRDVVYALAIGPDGLPVAATGNRGALIRIDSPARSTTLLTLPANQILALSNGAPGEYFAATGNIGRIYRVGPRLESRGTWDSDVFDSGAFSQWGRVISYGDEHGGKVSLQARAGNLDRPSHNWSPWSAPLNGKTGGRPSAPAARFLQVRATLAAAGTGASPELDSVETAYRTQNAAPHLDDIEITPPNYKFSTANTAPTTPRSPAAIVLSPIGQRSGNSTANNDVDPGSLTYAKGWIGARWAATDPNGDPLSFSVQIRGVQESDWKPLKEKIGDRHFSFDSTPFPDGEYRLRVIASDLPGNTKEDALTSELISSPFIIDNTPPRISALRAARSGSTVQCSWRAEDALNVIERAEYSIDGGDWTLVDPKGKLSDEPALEYSMQLPLPPGEHTIAVRVSDEADNAVVEKVLIR